MLMMGQREQDTSLEKRDADDGAERTGYIIREERC